MLEKRDFPSFWSRRRLKNVEKRDFQSFWRQRKFFLEAEKLERCLKKGIFQVFGGGESFFGDREA